MDGTAKPEDMRTQLKLGTDIAGTIAKLKANGFQYATAGDTRRLIEEIERLHRQLSWERPQYFSSGPNWSTATT